MNTKNTSTALAHEAQVTASTLRAIDAGGFVNKQLDKAAELIERQAAFIAEIEAELTTEKRFQRARDAAAVKTLGALGYAWHGSDIWVPAAQEKQELNAVRYRWLRERDLETLHKGGVFAGMTPGNYVLNGADLDDAIDTAIAAEARQGDAA